MLEGKTFKSALTKVQDQNLYEDSEQRCVEVVPTEARLKVLEDPVRFELDRKEHRQWWSVVFKDIKRWSPQLVASRRRVWLKVYGISMHVWEEGFFKQIGSFLGSLWTLTRIRLRCAAGCRKDSGSHGKVGDYQ